MKKKALPTFSFVLGTRPEIIKMFPIIHEVIKQKVPYEIIHTGQHYSPVMDKIIWNDLGLPRATRKLTLRGSSASARLGQMISKLSEYYARSPLIKRIILVQGDTNSTLAGALVAEKLQLPLVHLEAGFRSGNRSQPEEINRILVDNLSHLNIASNQTCLKNLAQEKLSRPSFVAPNTAYAAASYMNKIHLANKMNTFFPPFRLMTIHRAETVDDHAKLKNVISFAQKLARTMPLIWVLHPRSIPVMKRILKSSFQTTTLLSVRSIQRAKPTFLLPQSYKNFFSLLAQCHGVYSDSGGIVDEAVFLDRPYICLRSETEQLEVLESRRMILLPPTLPITELERQGLEFEQRKYPSLSQKEKDALVRAPEVIVEKIKAFKLS